MKAPFWLQAAAVGLLLLIGALCLPLPEGGIVLDRILGQPPAGSFTTLKPRPAVTQSPLPSPAPPPPALAATGPADRFAATLDFAEDESRSTDAWSAGLAAGKPAWRDNRSGMIWGPRLDLAPLPYDNEGLQKAMDACAAEEPKGSWALPSAAEFDIAKVNGLLKMDKDAQHRWLAFTVIAGAQMPAGRGYVPVSEEKHFSARCIARSGKAPLGGYLAADSETTLKAMGE